MKGSLLRAVDKLDAALNESRAALKGLRGSESIELSRQLSELANDPRTAATQFRLVIEGESRALRPAIQYEVFRIASEAVTNVFKHSGASSILVTLDYANGLQLLVRDDGKGIPQDLLDSGKEGHFGLKGMRERAERIGGALEVYSRVGTGTEVRLSIPGHLAFDKGAIKSFFLERTLSRITSFHRSR